MPLHSAAIATRLSAYMETRIYSMEIATTFNFLLFDEFSKAALKPIFVGEYFVDPASPEQTRVFCHQGTEACSPISIRRGVIGRAVSTGQDQYVPDVTKDKAHVGCDPNMEGSELVLISWSEPYPSGQHKGCRVPLGVLDIDLNVKDAFSEKDIAELKKIWEKYGKKIFPGVAQFEPKGRLFILRE
ncbi:MAG: hypothetical protein QW568_01865 [Candidatus Anstonellaceae archaeon]